MTSTAAEQTSNWNVPNALTTLRIVLVPFYGWALLIHDGTSIGWRITAYVLFAVAMITDKVDGDLARKHNLITNFGKIADPIADKAITGMALIGLAILGWDKGGTWWWVAIVVLLREWSVTLLRLSLLKHMVIPAAHSGKVKTMLQALALGGLTLPGRLLTGAWDIPGEVLFWASQVCLVGAVVMTLSSGYEFFRDAWRQRPLHG